MSEPSREPEPHKIVDHAPPQRVPDSPVIVAANPAPTPGQAVIVFSPRKVAATLSAIFCIGAGLYLLNVEPASKEAINNVIFTIAHGMGGYFVGKGIFCGAELWGPPTIIAPEVRRVSRMPVPARVAAWTLGVVCLILASMIAGQMVRATLSMRARELMDHNVERITK